MSAICLEQPIKNDRVKAIITNNSTQSMMTEMVHSGLDNNSAIALSNSLVEERPLPTRVERVQSIRRFSVASKFKEKIRDLVPLVVGIVALEAVLTFTFRPFEGLFLIIPTLGVGTTLYVADGIKR